MTAEARAAQCTSCGAVVETAAELAATRCAYCGSALVASDRALAAFDSLIPFRLGKAAALERLRAYIGDSWWTPQEIARLAASGRLRAERIHGVLVPHYAFDATVRGDYAARIGVHWSRKETREAPRKRTTHAGFEDVRVEGLGSETETRTVQETEWFDLRGSFGTQIDQHLTCASRGLADAEAHDLLPFDVGAAVPFDSRLMAGWHAELPSSPRREVDHKARTTIATLARRELERSLLPGDTHRIRTFETDIQLHAVRLLLAPVWIARVQLGKRMVRFVINGQTGACSGRVPVSSAKVAMAILAGALLLLAVLWIGGGLS